MRPLALLACLVALAGTVAGCGIGEGNERKGAGVELRVTRDFGNERLSATPPKKVREDQTVMRLLQRSNDVKTRFGGGFVQSIDGVQGKGSGGTEDWFYFVNGILADKGAAEYEPDPGDIIQWDYRDWGVTQDVKAIVGSFPEPFINGLEGKRLPTRVECADPGAEVCDQVKDKLSDIGAKVASSTLGSPGSQNVLRVVVAKYSDARDLPTVRALEQGPKESGVFVRFEDDGRQLALLDDHGNGVTTGGARTGLIAALRPTDRDLLWVVTGTDDAGVAAAADALDAKTIQDAFALVLDNGKPTKVPVVN